MCLKEKSNKLQGTMERLMGRKDLMLEDNMLERIANILDFWLAKTYDLGVWYLYIGNIGQK